MFFRNNKMMVACLIVISLILLGCNKPYQNNKETKQLEQFQQLLEKPNQSSGVHKPASNQYNSKPAEARVPYPPIPDQPVTPTQEAQ